MSGKSTESWNCSRLLYIFSNYLSPLSIISPIIGFWVWITRDRARGNGERGEELDVQSIKLDTLLPVLDWFGFWDDSVVGFKAFAGPIVAHEVEWTEIIYSQSDFSFRKSSQQKRRPDSHSLCP